jgi:predicted nucleotidyltransferase
VKIHTPECEEQALDSRKDRGRLLPETEANSLYAAQRDELVGRLRRALQRILGEQPVRLAYLHGSAASGQTHPFSDVDLALVIEDVLTPLEHLKLILRTQVDLADECGIPNVDVRVINDAPLVLRGRVVTDGILLFAKNEQERIAYEIDTRLRYFDYLPIHLGLQKAFFDDIQERGLYG